MHIFLTGAVQVGKSTVIDKTLKLLGITPGGFRTYFGPDRTAGHHRLYLCGGGEERLCDDAHAVAAFAPGRPPCLDVQRFEELALAALRNEGVPLLLMDECGRLEQQATRFHGRVYELLESDIPILGVLRQDADGWLDVIRSHPKVKVITVTTENRDALPEQLSGLLQNSFPYEDA